MSRYLSTALLALAAGSTLMAQPVVNDGGILNAASYISSRLPGGAIARGSIFVVFGARLGPATLAQAGFPLPSTLAGTSVRVSSGGQTLDCPLIYVVAGQLAAILPSNTPPGNATLTVTYNNQTSSARSFRVVNSAFGVFSLNQAGSGPGVITNFESASSQPVNTALRSARPGQTLILYGTGLGPLPPGNADNTAAPAVAINQGAVELYVGNRRASVAYAGRAPGFAGLDQVNFVVPGGVEGCSVPVAIKIGDIVSNYTTIAVAPNGGTCSDPLGLSSSQLDRIAAGQTLRLGSLGLARANVELTLPVVGTQNIITDTGTGEFIELNQAAINSGAALGFAGVSSLGTCFVYVGKPDQFEPTNPVPLKQLDAGPQINLNGPKGAKVIRRSTEPGMIGTYSESLFSGGGGIPGFPGGGDPDGYLVAGNYTFNNGSGGADVGGFNAQFNFPGNTNWTNRAAIASVNRSQGVTVNWSGGDPNGMVQIFGYSVSDTTDNAIAGFFNCIERASAGAFTVPPHVLLALPPSPTGGADSLTPLGALGVGGVSNPGSFTAPRLDFGVIFSTNVTLKSLNYQ
jgi:uncharacterized protein (TIGR03437 family)